MCSLLPFKGSFFLALLSMGQLVVAMENQEVESSLPQAYHLISIDLEYEYDRKWSKEQVTRELIDPVYVKGLGERFIGVDLEPGDVIEEVAEDVIYVQAPREFWDESESLEEITPVVLLAAQRKNESIKPGQIKDRDASIYSFINEVD